MRCRWRAEKSRSFVLPGWFIRAWLFSCWLSNDEEFPHDASCSRLYTWKGPVLFGWIPAQQSDALATRLALHARILQQKLKLHVCLIYKNAWRFSHMATVFPFQFGMAEQIPETPNRKSCVVFLKWSINSMCIYIYIYKFKFEFFSFIKRRSPFLFFSLDLWNKAVGINMYSLCGCLSLWETKEEKSKKINHFSFLL